MKNAVRITVFLVLSALFFGACARSPEQEMENAKTSLETITKAGAPIYAKAELKKLNVDLKAAQDEVYAQSKKLFKKYDKAREMLAEIKTGADALMPTIKVRKEISEKYPPAVSLYLGRDSKLVTSIQESFSIVNTYYSYGENDGPHQETKKFSYNLNNEKLNPVASYLLMLATANEAQVQLEFLIRRGKENIILATDKFKVTTDTYTSFHGFLTPKETEIMDGDEFVLRIRSEGNSFGMQFGPDLSSVAFFSPRAEIDDEILNQRADVINWIINNNKFGEESSVVYNIYRNIDELILNQKDGTWDIGKGLIKDGNYYALAWVNNKMKVDKLSEEQAKEKNLGENDTTFTR
jgi:hypothetical protein